MPEIREPELARIVYDAYPGRDLLPIDPARDCRSLKTLRGRVTRDNIGDGLFRFLVVEIVEGGEGNLDGAIRVVRRAREDVEAVLKALIRVRSRRGALKGRRP
jgi:hypothetical protein